jgi:hypothetical protein
MIPRGLILPTRPGGLRRFVIRLPVTFAVILLLIGGIADPASASYGFGRIKMDDARVDLASDESNTDHHLFWNHFAHFQMVNTYMPLTDLTLNERARFDWNSSTDIVWFAAAIGGPLADTRCSRVLLNGRCDKNVVRFEESYTRVIGGDAGFYFACHEFGHAIGFNDMTDACMRTGINPYAPPQAGQISSHMIGHINAQY